jgi:hypothetical protein
VVHERSVTVGSVTAPPLPNGSGSSMAVRCQRSGQVRVRQYGASVGVGQQYERQVILLRVSSNQTGNST